MVNKPPLALAGLAALRPFGLHEVSWHDGRVSMRAGFRGRELADLLGTAADRLQTRVAIDLRGSYRLVSIIPAAQFPILYIPDLNRATPCTITLKWMQYLKMFWKLLSAEEK